MDPDVPERAIAAFEASTGLTVCLHDRGRSLWPFLPPERFEHTNPVCMQVKRHRMGICRAFDADAIRDAGDLARQGLIKRCHAGIVEVVITVYRQGTLEWTLFAGIHRGALEVDLDGGNEGHGGPWAGSVRRLPPIDRATAERHLELLRQLAARLAAWREDLASDLPAERIPQPQGLAGRRQVITAFLVRAHERPDLRLADLADHLGLSEDRCGHLVREVCGETYQQMLTRLRLRTACGLLRHSDLPLREIARQSGFGDRAHFFAVFRKGLGTTPSAYRRQASGQWPRAGDQ